MIHAAFRMRPEQIRLGKSRFVESLEFSFVLDIFHLRILFCQNPIEYPNKQFTSKEAIYIKQFKRDAF